MWEKYLTRDPSEENRPPSDDDNSALAHLGAKVLNNCRARRSGQRDDLRTRGGGEERRGEENERRSKNKNKTKINKYKQRGNETQASTTTQASTKTHNGGAVDNAGNAAGNAAAKAHGGWLG